MATKKVKASVGRPPRTDGRNADNVPATIKGTKQGDKRKTYIVNEALAGKIDAIAYWQRDSVKDVVNEAFTDRVAKYEKKNGPVKTVKK